MFSRLRRQLDKFGSPALDWVQVEVTTYCNGSCVYCPHTLMQNSWANRHMTLELFNQLTPFLRHVDLVYLQGWGEPLLNTDFFEMVRICRNLGRRVGFTTNGVLLSEETMQMFVELQVDIVAVSLAGTTAGTHNQIRKGTDFDQVISNLERLRQIKDDRNSPFPAVHIAYLMLKSNFDELKKVLPLARRVAASQIVASNLTLIIDSKFSEEAIFCQIDRTDDYRNMLEEIKDRANLEGIIFDFHGPGLEATPSVCRENVRRACVINVDGEVVPCVLTNPILSSDYIFEGRSVPITAFSFGNIQDESLTRIWNNKEYADFRNLFDIKLGGMQSDMPQCCVACYKRLGA